MLKRLSSMRNVFTSISCYNYTTQSVKAELVFLRVNNDKVSFLKTKQNFSP